MKTSVLLLSTILLFAGCTSSNAPAPSTQKPAEPAPQLETARYGAQMMMNGARLWATDALHIRVESLPMSEANGQGGKAAVWRASFGSASRGKTETYDWNGIG